MIRKRNFFKTAGCVMSGSAICISSYAPVAFGMESSKVNDFHVGINEETKRKLIEALGQVRNWVITCLVQKNVMDKKDGLLENANLLHDDIENLLKLTVKCFNENRNLALSLAIQKTLNDVLKGMHNAEGKLIDLDKLYKINGDLPGDFEKWAPVGLKKMRSLCMVCKDILENKKNGNDSRESVDKKAELFRYLRFYLGCWEMGDKNEAKAKEIIMKLNAIGYDYKYEDKSLLEKVNRDFDYVEKTLQCFDNVRKFANDSYKRINSYKKNLNKVKGTLAVILKEILRSDYVGGLFKFLTKLNKHVGISNETKEKILRALDHFRDWVIASYLLEEIPDNHMLYEYANSLHDEIEELLNLTVECCNEGKNVAFSLAIQKVLSDIFKGMYNTEGELIDFETLGYIRVPETSRNDALFELVKMRGLCKACKEILEDKKNGEGRRSNYFTEKGVQSQALILNKIRAILENSPTDKKRIDYHIDDYRKIFGDPGYKYGDESLSDKVTKDSRFFNDLNFYFKKTRPFMYDSYEKINTSAIRFNPTFKEDLKSSRIIQYLYPFFTVIAIKDRINKLFNKEQYAGMYNIINKLDKNLFKESKDKGSPEEKQEKQLERIKEELKKVKLEHRKHSVKSVLEKSNVSEFLNKEEKGKLNKALEPSEYEFLLPNYS